jgi:1-deoxy-D-xylulose-5-phosphate reductoisomerase
MKPLAILGSTGSIGSSTVSVVEAFPDRFRLVALAGGHNLALLRDQIARHRPSMVSVAERRDAVNLAAEFPEVTLLSGEEGLAEVARHPEAEMVVSALVGAMGLTPTVAALRAGKHVALANKETLVVAGELVMREVATSGVRLLPVDSEHNALHQALRVGPRTAVQRMILTASGGPFREWPADRIQSATISDALAHPTWKMGAKITVDSATMMNKGLEIIEAHHLFGMAEERIDVLVHPQSLVHSLVEYVDGSLIAQLSTNDMRFPILYALAWPDRLPTPLPSLDLAEAGSLTFEGPDPDRFPALELARTALRAAGEMPAVLNAANEVAVQAFLDGRCQFRGITATVAAVLDRWHGRNRAVETVEQVLAADREARRMAAAELGNSRSGNGGSD